MKIKSAAKNQPICTILRKLMDESGLLESELARQVGLPQTTVNRLLLGGTSDPRAYTLKPIADFFGVTIGQLCGFEPMSSYRIPGTTNPIHQAAWCSIPIIQWDKLPSWIFEKNKLTPFNHPSWITTERQMSQNSFALASLSFMEPRFRKGSTLIVDPQLNFKDGHFVILALDGIQPTARRILIDGSDVLLRSFDQNQPLIKLKKDHHIYGVIVESRLDTTHD